MGGGIGSGSFAFKKNKDDVTICYLYIMFLAFSDLNLLSTI